MSTAADAGHQLVYLIYGNDPVYHDEARFSLLSALYRAADPQAFRIRVLTDQPEHYSGLPVDVQALTAAQLQDWFGPDRYSHRAKLCALREVAARAEKTVFIDTDTFFLQDPMRLFEAVNEQLSIVDEYYEAELPRHLTEHPAIAAVLAEQGFAAGPQAFINSGLFGFCRVHGPMFDQALALCDVMYPASNRYFAIEQLVLGLAASQRVRLQADDSIIKHYWSRKTLFRAKAQAFWRQYGADWDSAEARAAFAQVNGHIPKPPVLTRLAVKSLLVLVPARERQFLLEWYYGSHDYANAFDRAARTAWREKALDNVRARYPDVDTERALRRWPARWLRLNRKLDGAA